MSFHVPETRRVTPLMHPLLGSTREDGNNGAFILSGPEPGWDLHVIASDGDGWEHASVKAVNTVSMKLRTPTWKEMAYTKGVFWDAEDCVVQYHPPQSEYVNFHPNVLHLWRPTTGEFIRPPTDLVGPKA